MNAVREAHNAAIVMGGSVLGFVREQNVITRPNEQAYRRPAPLVWKVEPNLRLAWDSIQGFHYGCC